MFLGICGSDVSWLGYNFAYTSPFRKVHYLVAGRIADFVVEKPMVRSQVFGLCLIINLPRFLVTNRRVSSPKVIQNAACSDL